MVRMHDFWNRERWVHPDTECIPLAHIQHRRGYKRAQQERTCQHCGKGFKSAYNRMGCSRKCIDAIRTSNLLLARPNWKKKGESRKAKNLREYWQSKPLAFDAKIAARKAAA